MAATINVHRLLRAGGLIAVVVSMLGSPAPAFACASGPGNLPGTWCAVDGTYVRVWFEQSFVIGDDQLKAAEVRDVVDSYLWPLFSGFLGRTPLSDGQRTYMFNGGDGRYDIVLASFAAGQYGDSPLVFRTTPTAPPARFSMVNRTLVDRKLRSVVAHQLMRGFLTAFTCGAQCRWLEEATATWAEHLAYPNVNAEHEYAKYLFKNPKLSLHYDPSESDRHRFGAYVFLLFLQHRTARGASIVRDIWDATDALADPLKALDATVPGGLKGVWRDFITNNWNAAPAVIQQGGRLVPIYRAWDRLATGVYSHKGFNGPYLMDVRAGTPVQTLLETSLNDTLPPLSAKYFAFAFDLSVRTVRLDHNLKRLRAIGSGAELVVFTKRQGEDWRKEGTWETENSHVFCRDKATQNLEQMVVILGNSSRTTAVSFTAGDVTPKLVAGSEGCLTNPESGYEECRLEVPLTKWDGKTYQSVETQSWEITRVESATPNERIYKYKWMTAGAGAASQISSSSTWKSTWTIEGEGSGHVQVSLAQTPSGQTVQQAKKTDSAIDDSDAIKITEVKTEGGRSQITVHDPSTWWEYLRPRFTTLPPPRRIQGFAESPLTGWVSGQAPGGKELTGTITCRWSWPGVH